MQREAARRRDGPELARLPSPPNLIGSSKMADSRRDLGHVGDRTGCNAVINPRRSYRTRLHDLSQCKLSRYSATPQDAETAQGTASEREKLTSTRVRAQNTMDGA